jgi:broad specificity phosphatase PhoE
MTGTPVRILLARHGETVFNVEGRWQGQSDSPLSERGLAQARELARALAAEQISAVYSSSLGRAVATASEVAGPHGLPVRPDPALQEINVGDWTGKDGGQIDAAYPGLRKAWATTPGRMRVPGGETLLEMQRRALAFFTARMLDHLGETVVVIGHGALNQTILVNGLGGTVDDLWLTDGIDNCQISRLEWTPSSGLKLIELRDVRHLAEVGTLRSSRTTHSS